MKVVYLLEGAALYGGVNVVLQHARALRRRGVEAWVCSPDPSPSWFPGAEAFYRRVPEPSAAAIGPADIAIGTMWRTVPVVAAIPGAVPFHLCQCYEGLYDGVRDRWPEIDAVYRLPVRKLAVSPHLVRLLADRFGQSAVWIPQPFEPDRFRPPAAEPAAGARLRVLLAGHFSLPIKGVAWSMRALRPLAEEGWLQLVRLALEVDPEERRQWPDAEWHLEVPPAEVPELMRGADVYLGASSEVEGFGLPMLEAMGCARACVLSDIGSVKALDAERRASLRFDPGDADGLCAALRRLRDDPALRRRLGLAGRAIAERFSEERTAQALLAAFAEAGAACVIGHGSE